MQTHLKQKNLWNQVRRHAAADSPHTGSVPLLAIARRRGGAIVVGAADPLAGEGGGGGGAQADANGTPWCPLGHGWVVRAWTSQHTGTQARAWRWPSPTWPGGPRLQPSAGRQARLAPASRATAAAACQEGPAV